MSEPPSDPSQVTNAEPQQANAEETQQPKSGEQQRRPGGQQWKKGQSGNPAQRWKKGQSGNPTGMTKGTPHTVSRQVYEVVARSAPEVVQKVVDAAKAGDLNALALFIRLLPRPPRFIPIPLHLPPATSAAMALEQIALIVSKTAAGEIDIDTMQALLDGLRTYIVGLGGSELEARLKKYEELTQRRDEEPMLMPPPARPDNEADVSASAH
jgi:hypothetical protein